MTSTEKVQQLLIQIPYGKVTTYKDLAQAMGTRGYRAVGQWLNRNPDPQRFPCCKVVKSDGSLGGYALGPKEKALRLAAEGIMVEGGKIVDFEERRYRFA